MLKPPQGEGEARTGGEDRTGGEVRIEEQERRGRFIVTDESGPHAVNLIARTCSCPDSLRVRGPRRPGDGRPCPPKQDDLFVCPHLEAVVQMIAKRNQDKIGLSVVDPSDEPPF